MIDGYVGFLCLDKNEMPMVALHWEKYFQHIREKYNSIYKVQMPCIIPHVCRHTFCSNMAKSGMNPKTLQYIMGLIQRGLVLDGINNDVLSGNVTIISAPDLLEKGRIFDTSRIACKFLDENYEFVQYAVGSCSFGKGNESGVTFNIKDADKVMYLELECELPDEECNIFVKLK